MNIPEFIRESNRIEGIHRDPTEREMAAFDGFLLLPEVSVLDLQALVSVFQPGSVLREREGQDVRVGSHFPPPGGPEIRLQLAELLDRLDTMTPYAAHQEYETLHPFTDGNGRSGRALWAWHMREMVTPHIPLGFLHTWYYQSLQEGRKP